MGSVPSWIHWVTRGTPTERDEVNRREVCESDGCVCDVDVIGVKLRVIRKVVVLGRVSPTLDLSSEENDVR